MALTETCGKCGASFIRSAASPKWLCDDCDGTNEAARKEEERWAALTPDQKCDELRKAIKGLQRRSHWDGRIG